MERKPNPRRDELKALSAPFRILIKQGAAESVNACLVRMYEEQGHTNLNTLWQWNQQGKHVKKGEKALLLWGRPKEITIKKAIASGATEDELLNYFPICYVFSENQVG